MCIQGFIARTALSALIATGIAVAPALTWDAAAADQTTPAQIAKAITGNSGFKAELQPSKTSGDQPDNSGKRLGAKTASRTLKVEGLPLRGKQY